MDKQKHFQKLPLYGAVGCLIISASMVVYLLYSNRQYAAEPPMNCLGPNCPRIQAVASPGPISPRPQVSTRPQVPVTTGSDPCAFNTVSTQSYSAQGHRHRHRHHRHRKSFLDRWWEFILWLLEKFGITIPGLDPNNPFVPYPSRAPIPNPVNPCITPGAPSVTSPAQGKKINFRITYYDAYDNYLQGTTNIAYPKSDKYPTMHNKAGGTGTYADPLTFSASKNNSNFKLGDRIYVASVEKYFTYEDECPKCSSDQIELYVGNPSNTKAAVKCADSLAIKGKLPVIVNPGSGEKYDSTKLWDQSTGKCMTIHK